MSKTRQLLRREITYSTAKKEEVNILHQLKYPSQQADFINLVQSRSSWIKAVVSHHLNLSSDDACSVSNVDDWLGGTYNLCVPVTVAGWKGKKQAGDRVILRLPLPYRDGEAFRPGNGDEKIRTEAGTYVWLQGQCPEIPIPKLYGFGLSTGRMFTRIDNLSPLSRCVHFVRCCFLSLLGRPVPSEYVPHQGYSQLAGNTNIGYMLVEYIEESAGKMLSESWAEKKNNSTLRSNLYRSLSRLFISLAKIPLPAIGSFAIDDDGFVHLSNRPLFLGIQELENENIPIDIPRDRTYSCVESFVVDVLSCHNSRLEHQPNAINDIMDYASQAGALTAMQAIFPLFFRRDLRRGPFVFTLTDIHQSNIFVDEDWNITSLVDLEWGCSLPVEMLQPPHWFVNQYVDKIENEDFDNARKEFMVAFTAEEQGRNLINIPKPLKLSSIMDESWEMGTFWYQLGMFSPTGIFRLFDHKLKPRFVKKPSDHEAFWQIMPWYWSQDFVNIMVRKVKDRENYDAQLQEAFEDTHGR
ncbi:predicted protein [Uncinocarpus reesii 1704]|uniref:Aminoglycoside phosphotransferase domain-containing protein n=1 Tax=Uncinocarpus reesii (strain UAMH 1704) TaxID=336963 RepID=C4JZU4_UNCRE|nr:uncharacterized protein UREG_07695 [Uncinocarpus reesii 1704]EEP82830.1 predicted protein [Uncinocarpus reesii 1704]